MIFSTVFVNNSLLFCRDEKEKWIRSKYEAKEFLPPPPYLDIPLNQVRSMFLSLIRYLRHAFCDFCFSWCNHPTWVKISFEINSNWAFFHSVTWKIVDLHSTHLCPFCLQQLIDALVREDIRNIILVLGHSHPEDINCPYSKDDGRTALHIAAALGNVVYVQLLLWVCYSSFHWL